MQCINCVITKISWTFCGLYYLSYHEPYKVLLTITLKQAIQPFKCKSYDSRLTEACKKSHHHLHYHYHHNTPHHHYHHLQTISQSVFFISLWLLYKFNLSVLWKNLCEIQFLVNQHQYLTTLINNHHRSDILVQQGVAF